MSCVKKGVKERFGARGEFYLRQKHEQALPNSDRKVPVLLIELLRILGSYFFSLSSFREALLMQ
jgi:hypothetical protein